MKVVMIGTGYVGLVSGACFADFGHDVSCIDKDKDKIDRLKAGHVPFFEPGLDELFASNLKWGRLHFSTCLKHAVGEADAVFIAVGTPTSEFDRRADLSYVSQAAKEIAGAISGYTVIINKSTVPVGTGQMVEDIIASENPDAQFSVVSNPEFLREGSAIGDFKRPDRVIVGTEDERARAVMRELYRPLYLNETPILFTNRPTAELTKYAANAFLATKISFINEIADLCEKTGANVQQVSRGIGLDGRIGSKFLHAGPGYGGSCFPKDTRALVHTGQEHDVPMRIVDAVVSVNETRKLAMAGRIISACGGDVNGKRLAVLGLTFKPNTDDMRDAPSLDIIPALQARGAKICAYDPEGMQAAAKLLNDVKFSQTAYECIKGADALVLITEWDQFRALDLKKVADLLNNPVIIDLRNIYEPGEMQPLGLKYYSIGRAAVC